MYINILVTSRVRKENSVFYKAGNIVYSQCTAVLHSPLKTNECFGVVFFLSFGRLGLIRLCNKNSIISEVINVKFWTFGHFLNQNVIDVFLFLEENA